MGQTFCQRRAPDGGAQQAGGKQNQSQSSARKDDMPKPKQTASKPSAEKPVARNVPNAKVEGKTAEEWKTIGNEAVKKADHSAGYEAYCKGLKADPDHAMILSNRALCLEKLGRLEEAVADAKRCASLKPDFVKAFLRAATILRDLKRPEEAVEILKRAPSNAEVEQLLAKLAPEASKASKARLASMSQAEKLKEEGNQLFKKGSIEKALEVYTKALKACKDQKGEVAVAIRNNRAGCYQQLSDFRNVVAETNFVLEQQPDNVKALLRRMLALEPLEKYEEALADARLVIRHCPGNEVANKMQHRLGKLVRDSQRDTRAAGA